MRDKKKWEEINQELRLKIKKYKASGGDEYFIEYIDNVGHLFGFLRLRVLHASDALVYCYTKTSIVRELHVYGKSVPIGEKKEENVQHNNLGSLLLKRAELITKNLGLKKIAVISGVGAREYYRKKGYVLSQTYMLKKLS